jgi:hypothetical protein
LVPADPEPILDPVIIYNGRQFLCARCLGCAPAPVRQMDLDPSPSYFTRFRDWIAGV